MNKLNKEDVLMKQTAGLQGKLQARINEATLSIICFEVRRASCQSMWG